jgi:dihydroorotate dehydrogenase (fumarate)
MANIKTRFMGLELKSPIIAGASNLVTNIENLKRIERSGAGAIVYKSLFEEQVQLESLEFHERITEYDDRNAEMTKLFPEQNKVDSNIKDHLNALRKAKESVSIPVFASINAVNNETWVEYAIKMQETGVDGLELNFYAAPEKDDNRFEETENNQIRIFRDVRSAVTIPVSVKLSPYYSNPLKLISDLDKSGADAFILFNRLFQPDIDIDKEEHFFPYSLSNKEDSRLPLRFAGLLYGNTKSSVCTSSGIINSSDVIKMILAGADCVQVVSTLYLNQIEVISTILSGLEKWMDSKGYATLASFRGKLSKKSTDNKLPYHRNQYMDFMMTTSEILKKYKVIN